MVSWIFQKVRKTLQETPLLWGIVSWPGLLRLAGLAMAFGLFPLRHLPNLVLSGSVALIFLRAYQGILSGSLRPLLPPSAWSSCPTWWAVWHG